MVYNPNKLNNPSGSELPKKIMALIGTAALAFGVAGQPAVRLTANQLQIQQYLQRKIPQKTHRQQIAHHQIKHQFQERLMLKKC